MNVKLRQSIYYLGVVGGGLVGLLTLFGVLSPEVAALIAAPLAALTGGTAGGALARQRREGTLDFSGSAPDQAIAAIQATISQAQTAQADAARVAEAVTGALSAVPIAGPVANRAGSLLEQVIAQADYR